MTDWFVGQKVVCIADRSFWWTGWRHAWSAFLFGAKMPTKDAIYTVACVGMDTGLDGEIGLELLELKLGWHYSASGFRPLVEFKNDISAFVRILDRINRRKTEDA